MMSISCVQADHNSCRCDTDHPIPENHLLRAIEGDEAGCFRFPEADRLSGMGDLVRYRLRGRLLGWKANLLAVELTPIIPASDQIDEADRRGALSHRAAGPCATLGCLWAFSWVSSPCST